MAIANRTPKHARPRQTLRKAWKGTLLLAASAAVALAVAVPIGFAQAPISPAERTELGTITATTTAMVTTKPVNWTSRTCSAFTAWQQHQTAANLSTLVIDATHLGKGYLKADVGQLFADASSPSAKAPEYVSVSAQYVGEDCFGGA